MKKIGADECLQIQNISLRRSSRKAFEDFQMSDSAKVGPKSMSECQLGAQHAGFGDFYLQTDSIAVRRLRSIEALRPKHWSEAFG